MTVPKFGHSILGRQFSRSYIRNRYTRSADQRARSRLNYGSYGTTYRESKRWNQAIYSARRRKHL